jgi:hypothetical protein
MDKNRQALVKLRVSLARVAQAAGVSLRHLGLNDDAPYDQLCSAAENRGTGWNTLAARIVDKVQEGRTTET